MYKEFKEAHNLFIEKCQEIGCDFFGVRRKDGLDYVFNPRNLNHYVLTTKQGRPILVYDIVLKLTNDFGPHIFDFSVEGFYKSVETTFTKYPLESPKKRKAQPVSANSHKDFWEKFKYNELSKDEIEEYLKEHLK